MKLFLNSFVWLGCLKIIDVKSKLSHSSLPSSNKLFVVNTALNFWIKILWCQQFNIPQLVNSSAWSWAVFYKVYESPAAASLSSPVPESQCSRSTVKSQVSCERRTKRADSATYEVTDPETEP